MNAILTVRNAVRREGQDQLADAVAKLFADHGVYSPATKLAEYGCALLRAALDFDPRVPLVEGLTTIASAMSDRDVEALAEELISLDAERYFAQPEPARAA